jgi:DNA polymerase-3 subunit epsilon
MIRQWRHRKRCRLLARKSRQAVLNRYIDTCSDLKVDTLENTPVIAVDLELTGLDPKKNHIIAIGWTQVDRGRIRFGSNRHVIINSDHSVGDSAAIHEMMDHEVAGGVSLGEGLEMLFEAALGRIWLFHHGGLDVSFLQKACLAWAGVAPPFAMLDTMQMEMVMRKRRDLPILHGELQLGKLRASYHLPTYTAHNALIDACATAELMLAQAAKLDPSGSLRLKPHMRYFRGSWH